MSELEVEIYGKKYLLRGTDPEAIRAVAKVMDQRMRQMFGSEPKPLESGKLFALAINFAEEVYHLQKESAEQEQKLMEKLERLDKKLAGLEKMVEL